MWSKVRKVFYPRHAVPCDGCYRIGSFASTVDTRQVDVYHCQTHKTWIGIYGEDCTEYVTVPEMCIVSASNSLEGSTTRLLYDTWYEQTK